MYNFKIKVGLEWIIWINVLLFELVMWYGYRIGKNYEVLEYFCGYSFWILIKVVKIKLY